MPRYYFHLSNSHELITDNIGSEVSDVAAAHRRAVQLADRVVSFSGLADREPDWRRWIVRVTDQSQLPIVTVIFPACFMTEKQEPLWMSKAPVRYRLFSTRCLRAPDDCCGSFATEPTRASAEQCPLCAESDHSRHEFEWTLCATSKHSRNALRKRKTASRRSLRNPIRCFDQAAARAAAPSASCASQADPTRHFRLIRAACD